MFRNIVVGTDFSELGTSAVRAASELADKFEVQTLHVLHASELPAGLVTAGAAYAIPAPMTEQLTISLIEDAEKRLARTEVAVRSRHVQVVKKAVIGAPARELAAYAERVGADLIVIATHARSSVARWILGSVARTLAAVAPCPVMVVRSYVPGVEYRKILAPVDMSSVSDEVLRHAAALVSPVGSVRIVSVFETPTTIETVSTGVPPEIFESARAKYERELIRTVRRHFPSPSTATVELVTSQRRSRALADLIDDASADLVVVGTSGHGALHRMVLGSTTSLVLDHAPGAVLIVPPPKS